MTCTRVSGCMHIHGKDIGGDCIALCKNYRGRGMGTRRRSDSGCCIRGSSKAGLMPSALKGITKVSLGVSFSGGRLFASGQKVFT